MFEGIEFVEFCNDTGNGCSFIAAIRDLSETGFNNLELLVHAAAETMTTYDSFEEKVREVLNGMNVEYEIIYPDHFITIG